MEVKIITESRISDAQEWDFFNILNIFKSRTPASPRILPEQAKLYCWRYPMPSGCTVQDAAIAYIRLKELLEERIKSGPIKGRIQIVCSSCYSGGLQYLARELDNTCAATTATYATKGHTLGPVTTFNSEFWNEFIRTKGDTSFAEMALRGFASDFQNANFQRLSSSDYVDAASRTGPYHKGWNQEDKQENVTKNATESIAAYFFRTFSKKGKYPNGLPSGLYPLSFPPDSPTLQDFWLLTARCVYQRSSSITQGAGYDEAELCTKVGAPNSFGVFSILKWETFTDQRIAIKELKDEMRQDLKILDKLSSKLPSQLVKRFSTEMTDAFPIFKDDKIVAKLGHLLFAIYKLKEPLRPLLEDRGKKQSEIDGSENGLRPVVQHLEELKSLQRPSEKEQLEIKRLKTLSNKFNESIKKSNEELREIDAKINTEVGKINEFVDSDCNNTSFQFLSRLGRAIEAADRAERINNLLNANFSRQSSPGTTFDPKKFLNLLKCEWDPIPVHSSTKH